MTFPPCTIVRDLFKRTGQISYLSRSSTSSDARQSNATVDLALLDLACCGLAWTGAACLVTSRLDWSCLVVSCLVLSSPVLFFLPFACTHAAAPLYTVQSASGLAFIWEESNQVLGFICAHDLGFRAYLSEFIVDKSGRNRKIGKMLLKHVEHELINRGSNVLIADVWKDAEGFYKSLGWSEPDVILLRKKLVQ